MARAPRHATSVVIGSRIEGSSFSGLLTRVEIGHMLVPKFAFYPSWRIKKLSKDLKDTDAYDEIDWLDSDRCDGGAFYLWSEGRLKCQDPGYVWLGYSFELSLDDRALTKHLYAGVGTSDRPFEDHSKNFETFPDYGKAQKGARTMIRKQIKEAIKSGNVPGGKRLAGLGKALDNH
jgi:hypothetical protein